MDLEPELEGKRVGGQRNLKLCKGVLRRRGVLREASLYRPPFLRSKLSVIDSWARVIGFDRSKKHTYVDFNVES